MTSLKKRKSAGVDNIPAELVQAGGEAMIDALHIICSKIWQTGKWPTRWTQSLIITLPKKGNLQMCQNYRTISLISHPSKVMLKILLNRLQLQAEEIIAEEQAGFRMGRSTTEQVFNLIVLMEKYQQHQQDLYHIFIDFKKAFDRVWHAALWTTMHKYNIGANLMNVVSCAYYLIDMWACVWGEEVELVQRAGMAVSHQKIKTNVVSCAYYLIDMCACVWGEEVELVQRAGMAVSHQKIKTIFNLLMTDRHSSSLHQLNFFSSHACAHIHEIIGT